MHRGDTSLPCLDRSWDRRPHKHSSQSQRRMSSCPTSTLLELGQHLQGLRTFTMGWRPSYKAPCHFYCRSLKKYLHNNFYFINSHIFLVARKDYL